MMLAKALAPAARRRRGGDRQALGIRQFRKGGTDTQLPAAAGAKASSQSGSQCIHSGCRC